MNFPTNCNRALRPIRGFWNKVGFAKLRFDSFHHVPQPSDCFDAFGFYLLRGGNFFVGRQEAPNGGKVAYLEFCSHQLPRPAACASFVRSGFSPLSVLVFFVWKTGNGKLREREGKKGQMGKGRFWLKVASASFRTQLFAVVSLLLVFYPAGGVGNFFGRKMSDRKY